MVDATDLRLQPGPAAQQHVGHRGVGDRARTHHPRQRHRRQLLGIAARDTTADDPVEFLPEVARALADLAGSAVVGRPHVAEALAYRAR